MIEHLIKQTEEDIKDVRQAIRQLVETNQLKVLNAFRDNKIADVHFQGTTGYGYDDIGRDGLEAVYRDVFKTEDALVRPQLISGTHAITTALFGILRPGDELIYMTGDPYDTLEEVIGTRGQDTGSLMDFGVHYQSIPLMSSGAIDYDALKHALKPQTKVVAIQRSKGYADRPSFTIDQIEEMIQFVKAIDEDIIIFVDNCYGEFVETKEPTEVGADLIAGSLIKNPGGGISRIGGYIAGRKDLLELAGFTTTPKYTDKRTDLIQSVTFNTADQMVKFCQAIQHASPINAYVTPHPAPMPGYESDVIMAAGTFIQGASLELTADGPLRAPYTAFVQGGLTYSHEKLAVSEAVMRFVESGDLII